MAIFTYFMLFATHQISDGGEVPLVIFIVAFWAIGAGLMAGAINMGKRQAVITAGKSGLTVTESGLFGQKRREFRREDVAAIRADASGMKVNDVDLIELQIHPVTGKKAGLFVGRDDDELRWMATELRKALGVPAKKQDEPTKG
jgi:hypothetical protein